MAPALGVFGAAAIGGFVKSAVGAASDLSESTSKVGVVFGKQAGQIEAASKRSAKAMGLSQQAYLEATGTLGNLLVSLDIAPKKAAGLSTQMVKLAGDLASFNNASPEEALDALRSGLTGETEPLKRFGVNMNDATLRAQALKLGLIKTTKDALSPQTKALAAQALIMDQTKTAQGDFARTSGGLANQQRILSAEVEDVKAKIGTALLPIVVKAATYLSKTAVPAFSKFVGEMEDGTGRGGELVDTLKDVWGATEPVVKTVGKLVGAFADLPSGTKKVLLLAGAALILKNRFGDSIPTLQSFSREGALAAAKTVAIRGGALAAGAGLATLASEAGGAKTDLGGLATIGAGIATGFAVGGPWGAAIGGAAGILSVFSAHSASAAAAQDKLDSAGKRVADTLNQQTGALTANSRAVAAKELADSGALAAAKAMKIPLSDVLNASLGNAAAIKSVTAASEAWANAQAKNGTYTEKQEGQLQTLRNSIGSTSQSIADQRKKIIQVHEAMNSLDGVTATVKVKANTTGFFDGIGSVFSALDRAIQKAAKVKVGKNAQGTDNWRGGLTWVGEKGPELINLAKGAQVIPNHKIGQVGATRNAADAGPSLVDLSDGSVVRLAEAILAGAHRVATGVADTREYDTTVKSRMPGAYAGGSA